MNPKFQLALGAVCILGCLGGAWSVRQSIRQGRITWIMQYGPRASYSRAAQPRGFWFCVGFDMVAIAVGMSLGVVASMDAVQKLQKLSSQPNEPPGANSRNVSRERSGSFAVAAVAQAGR